VIRAAALILAACHDANPPHLDSVTPTSASANTIVQIVGEHLCGPTGDCASAGGDVQLGLSPPTVQAIIVSYADTVAQIQIPAITPIGKTSIVFTVDDRASNALAFEVLP
jgi:hypothetical protein